MTTYVLPYNMASKSAKILAKSLGVRRIRRDHTKSKFVASPKHLVINWGCPTQLPHIGSTPIINRPEAVNLAANKLVALRELADGGVSVPDFTTDQEAANAWLEADGGTILCRTVLRGNSGAGIVVANKPEELVPAPLYVRYVPKRDEYRVHVFDGELLHVQQKKRSREIPDEKVDWKIRNTKNGFIFAIQDVTPPDAVVDQALKAVGALGLDFGAVDVIWNEHREQAYVLEVNCAPGLEGTTLEKYVNTFKSIKDPQEW